MLKNFLTHGLDVSTYGGMRKAYILLIIGMGFMLLGSAFHQSNYIIEICLQFVGSFALVIIYIGLFINLFRNTKRKGR